MARIDKEALEAKAVELVRKEVSTWEDAVCFVTERVAFQMRNLIRLLRKNFFGIFDEPTDPVTGQKKIFIPLTESTIEAVVKNIDLDTKDINFRAKKKNALGVTKLVRSIVRHELDEMGFGEKLDVFERQLAIDGTAVWKTYEKKKGEMEVCQVDLLNIYIDPSAESIQKAYRFTERSLMSLDDAQGQTEWLHPKDVVAQENLSTSDPRLSGTISTASGSKWVDAYEMWGKIPKSLITGNDEDENKEVDGHIIVTGLERKGNAKCQLVEENKKGKKPYEEAWYTRVNGRWYGRGVAEKLMMLQIWMNEVANTRRNRQRVSQLGLFKIRRGANITPQMVSRLATSGAILVNDPRDIEQLVINDVPMSSYKEEEVINNWSQRTTSSFDISAGESLPASTPATNAAIQNQNAQSTFVLIKEQVGMFLQRWLKNHVIPILQKKLTKDEIYRLTGDIADLSIMDQQMVDTQIAEIVKNANARGIPLDTMQLLMVREAALERARRSGADRFVNYDKEMELSDYDVQVYITNEEMDKGVLTRNLLDALRLAPQFQEEIIKQVFDIMGLDTINLNKPNQMQLAPGQPQMGQPMPMMNPQEQVTQANTVNA